MKIFFSDKSIEFGKNLLDVLFYYCAEMSVAGRGLLRTCQWLAGTTADMSVAGRGLLTAAALLSSYCGFEFFDIRKIILISKFTFDNPAIILQINQIT